MSSNIYRGETKSHVESVGYDGGAAAAASVGWSVGGLEDIGLRSATSGCSFLNSSQLGSFEGSVVGFEVATVASSSSPGRTGRPDNVAAALCSSQAEPPAASITARVMLLENLFWRLNVVDFPFSAKG